MRNSDCQEIKKLQFRNSGKYDLRKFIFAKEVLNIFILYLHLFPVSYIYRQVNDYPISFVLFVLHCKFNNQHNRKTKVAFDEKTTGPFDVYPCLFTF